MAVKPASRLTNNVNYDSLLPKGPGDYYGKYHPQPEAWRQTGRGLAVQNTAPVATEFNANAVLVNRGTVATDRLAKIYLYVDAVETSWSVAGEYAQAHDAKSWYPRNLHQDLFVIEGFVPSQDEFDKLVRFVDRHHYTALHGAEFNTNWFHFVDFLLFRPKNHNTFAYFPQTDTSHEWELRDDGGLPVAQKQLNALERKLAKYSGLNYGILILDIDAGHERFQFAPAFSMQCKVVDDRRDPHANNIVAMYQTGAATIDYQQVFYTGQSLAKPSVANVTPPKPKPKQPNPSSIGALQGATGP